MKRLSNLLCTLLPWTFFWAGKALGLAAWGLAAAIAGTVLICQTGWHRMKAPDWTQLLFFCLVLAGLFLSPLAWAAEFQGLLAPALFTLMAFGSLLFRHPFTIKYAREEIPASFWKDPGFTPHFLRVNHILTALWGLVFALSLLCAGFALGSSPGLDLYFHLLPAGAFLAATLLTKCFPPWYQKKFYEPDLSRGEAAKPVLGKIA